MQMPPVNQVCQSEKTELPPKMGKGPRGTHLPWQKMYKGKLAKRLQSSSITSSNIRGVRKGRVEENIKVSGLGGLGGRVERTDVTRCFDKLGPETYKEKLARKVGLLRKPWERVELAGHYCPTSSSDEELGHEREPRYTRSLFDLSPGHLHDESEDEGEEDAVEDVKERPEKKKKL